MDNDDTETDIAWANFLHDHPAFERLMIDNIAPSPNLIRLLYTIAYNDGCIATLKKEKL